MLKVAKFGGTSLANVANIKKVLQIIDSDNTIQYVVVSAPGKRSAADDKITDMLYKCYDDVVCGVSAEKAFKPIEERFVAIASELGAEIDFVALFSEVKMKLTEGAVKDYIISRGEYFMAKILSVFLGWDFLNAEKIIKFDKEGVLDEKTTLMLTHKQLGGKKRTVVPGFYGALPNGRIKTFSRGGSDVTGAIIAKSLGAEIYENWTDVDGVMICDPNIVGDTKHVASLNYEEILALACYGATVIHPDAIKVLLCSETSVNIKNTFNPSGPGTLILCGKQKSVSNKKAVGISGAKGFFTVILNNINFINKNIITMEFVSVFDKNGLNIERLLFGANSVSVTMRDSGTNEETLCKVLNDLKSLCGAKSVEVIRHFAIIAVVATGIVSNAAVLENLFCSLNSYDIINVVPSSDGACLLISLPESEYESCIRSIYKTCT